MRELTRDTKVALRGWAAANGQAFNADRKDGEMLTRELWTGETVEMPLFSRDWIILQLYKMAYKDEFDFIVEEMRNHMSEEAEADFSARIALLPPRSDTVFAQLLEERKPAGYTPKEA